MAQRAEGVGAQSRVRRSEGPESREQGAGGQVGRWAGVRRADLMLGRKRRERESPGLGKEQPAAMAMKLGT